MEFTIKITETETVVVAVASVMVALILGGSFARAAYKAADRDPRRR